MESVHPFKVPLSREAEILREAEYYIRQLALDIREHAQEHYEEGDEEDSEEKGGSQWDREDGVVESGGQVDKEDSVDGGGRERDKEYEEPGERDEEDSIDGAEGERDAEDGIYVSLSRVMLFQKIRDLCDIDELRWVEFTACPNHTVKL